VIDNKGPGISLLSFGSLLLLLDLEVDKHRGTGTVVPSNGDLVLAGAGDGVPIFTLIGITGVGGCSGFAFGLGIFFGWITGVGSPCLFSFLLADLDLSGGVLTRGTGGCGARYKVSGDVADTSIGSGDAAAAATAAAAPCPAAITPAAIVVGMFKLLLACC
jgi:hypothetical protein